MHFSDLVHSSRSTMRLFSHTCSLVAWFLIVPLRSCSPTAKLLVLKIIVIFRGVAALLKPSIQGSERTRTRKKYRMPDCLLTLEWNFGMTFVLHASDTCTAHIHSVGAHRDDVFIGWLEMFQRRSLWRKKFPRKDRDSSAVDQYRSRARRR